MKDSSYLPAKAALGLLGIKSQSLYAYVSRGWIRSIAGGPRGRERLYLREDVERVLARSRARRGHGAAAAGAARWGDPILESSIALITDRSLRYRSRDVFSEILPSQLPFENVAEYLWSGTWVEGPVSWAIEAGLKPALAGARKLSDPKARFASFISSVALGSECEDDLRVDRALALWRPLYRSQAGLFGRSGAVRVATVCAEIALRLGARHPEAARAIDEALILCADHELNTSTFVARIAASNQTGLLLCVEAALATHRGARQGLAADALERAVARAPGRGPIERLPGFGHPLYPHGDPRGRFLMERARMLAKSRSVLAKLENWIQRSRSQFGEEPNLDCGLVGLGLALGLPPRSSSALFCYARMAGWIAHVFEQRQAGFQIRPRARFVG